jgi:DNA-binding PadR family transcriptional regulator
LLARQPLSGYDLLKRLEQPIGFFWHARRSQIYPQLARLEAAGLVTHARVAQHDRPDKKVFSITEAGRGALRAWVEAPMPRQPERDEFMLKVFSIWLAAPTAALALFRAHEREHAERLALYEANRAEMERDWPPAARRVDSPKFASYATLRRGIEYERGYVEWCRWMAETLIASMLDGKYPDLIESPPTQP